MVDTVIFDFSVVNDCQTLLLQATCCLVAQSCPILTPETVANHAPLSVGFPRQEHWSGLPFPSPGDLPDPGIEAMPPAGGFFTTDPPGKPSATHTCLKMCNTAKRFGNYYLRKFQNGVLKSKLPYCVIINGYVHIYSILK